MAKKRKKIRWLFGVTNEVGIMGEELVVASTAELAHKIALKRFGLDHILHRRRAPKNWVDIDPLAPIIIGRNNNHGITVHGSKAMGKKKKKAKTIFDRYVATCPKCKRLFGRSTPTSDQIPYFCSCTQGSNSKYQLQFKLNPDGPGEYKPRPRPAASEKPERKKREKVKKQAVPKMDLPSDIKKLLKMLKKKPPKHEARQIRAALRTLGHKGGLKGAK